MINHNNVITQLSWDEIRETLRKLDGAFVEIMDNISPKQDFSLFAIDYQFGDTIVLGKTVKLPHNQDKLVPTLEQDLFNSTPDTTFNSQPPIPLMMLLDKTTECCTQQGHHILPWEFFKAGQFMTLSQQFDYPPYYHPARLLNIYAGARSLFMLPKIGDNANHTKLKRKFKLTESAPQYLSQQWRIFRELSQQVDLQCDWRCRILLFPHCWMRAIKRDPAWLPLKQYLQQKAWEYNNFKHNQPLYHYTFSRALAQSNIKADPYLIDTAKHLMSIACFGMPAFRPSTDDSSGPVDLLQKVYIEHYGLKHYTPVVLQPDYYNVMGAPIYYSLQNPTTFSFSPKTRRVASTLANLCEIKTMMDQLIQSLQMHQPEIHNTILDHLAHQVKFDFIHAKPNDELGITSIKSIPTVDTRIPNNGQFSESGTFLRGCIRIMHQAA